MSATARNRVGRSAKKGNRCLDRPCTGSATRCDLSRLVAHAAGLTSTDGWRNRSNSSLSHIRPWHPAQVPPADLDISVLGQLPPPQLPLGDALEAGPLEVVGFDAPIGARPLRQ
jgi:hypothetical protein